MLPDGIEWTWGRFSRFRLRGLLWGTDPQQYDVPRGSRRTAREKGAALQLCRTNGRIYLAAREHVSARIRQKAGTCGSRRFQCSRKGDLLMDHLEGIEKVCRIEADAIGRAYRSIDPVQFDKAVRLLLHAPRIATCGCGHSGFSCMHFAQLLCCIERPARFMYPDDAIHGALGFLLSGDVIVLCSISGRTNEVLTVEEMCRRKHVRIIALTEDRSSPLARRADILLKLPTAREADKFGSQSTTSFAAANAVLDALQNAIIERIGFIERQYAADTLCASTSGADGQTVWGHQPSGGPSD